MPPESALPARYREPWEAPFRRRIDAALRPGISILDVGSGRRPTLLPEERPAGCRYVGLDLSRSELEAAPAGSYDEMWVADATVPVPELAGRFDLVISWQVLEHVKPLERAMANVHAYLVPGGRFVAQLSGTFSVFALINLVIPHRLAKVVLNRLLHRPPDSIFPAHYHRCWYAALRRLVRPWTRAEVVPRYTGAGYFAFSRVLQRGYLVYEEWTRRRPHRNLATHYIVDAVK